MISTETSKIKDSPPPSCDIPEDGNLHKQGKGKEKEDTKAESKEWTLGTHSL